MKPGTYKLKGLNNQDIGFFTQEIIEIMPEIVFGKEDEMTLSNGQIAPALVKAVQEKQKLIDQLQETNTELFSASRILRINST